jgi:methylmalonyl-CoA/ethylmalonyl-CoA epimerase
VDSGGVDAGGDVGLAHLFSQAKYIISPAQGELMLSTIKQIAVAVADLEKSKRFYGDMLGLKQVYEVPGQMVFFDLAGIWLMLSRPEGEFGARPGSTLYFAVDDIHGAHRQLRDRGVEFIDEPHRIADMGSYELWMSFFRDPDDTVLAIRAEVAK